MEQGADKKWKPGDVVSLKSGGPPMTVRAYVNDHVDCQWFTTTGKSRGGYFAEEGLVPIEKTSGLGSEKHDFATGSDLSKSPSVHCVKCGKTLPLLDFISAHDIKDLLAGCPGLPKEK